MTMDDHHRTGQSVDDAVALLTASLGEDVDFSRRARLCMIGEMVEGPDAGSRLAAALEALATLAAGIIEVYVDAAGDDPGRVVASFTLLDLARRPRP